MKDVRMLFGAPPDSELTIRIKVQKDMIPDPENYQSDFQDDSYMKLIDGSLLGYLKYEKRGIDENNFGIDELLCLESADGPEVIFELVDKDGLVWTEYYEVPDV